MFTSCGEYEDVLKKDILKMDVPMEVLKMPYILPMRYGYDEKSNMYFVSELKDRSNDWITLFSTSDGEEFRWYILRELSENWGRKYELEYRDQLCRNWLKVHKEVVNGEWIYDIHSNAKYLAVYSSGKETWEFAIKVLLRVFDIGNHKMKKYIEEKVSILNLFGEKEPNCSWDYSVDTFEFIMKNNQ